MEPSNHDSGVIFFIALIIRPLLALEMPIVVIMSPGGGGVPYMKAMESVRPSDVLGALI